MQSQRQHRLNLTFQCSQLFANTQHFKYLMQNTQFNPLRDQIEIKFIRLRFCCFTATTTTKTKNNKYIYIWVWVQAINVYIFADSANERQFIGQIITEYCSVRPGVVSIVDEAH